MSLSFFKALNPLSKKSGITYNLDRCYPCQGKEMIDRTVPEVIKSAFNDDLSYLEGLEATFNIIVGGHYDLSLTGANDAKGGYKGVLDFFVLPLIARKLIADSYLKERKNKHFLNALAWIVAIPIEIARFGAGVALTILAAPVVAIVHCIKAIVSFVESREKQSRDEHKEGADLVMQTI